MLTALLVSAVFASSVPVAAATVPDRAQAVVDAASAALGARALRNTPSIHVTVRGIAAGLPLTGDSWIDLRARTFANYASLRVFTLDTGFDGRDAWTRDNKGVVWVDGSVAGHATALNEAFRDSYALFTPQHGGALLGYAGARTEKNKTFDVVSVKLADSPFPWDMWVERTTHLPARVVESVSGVSTTTDLSDYRNVHGLRYPFAQHQRSSQGNEVTLSVQHAEVAPQSLSQHLTKPATTVNDYAIEGATQTTIPFDLIDNHVYLNVTLNGKGPYRFIFDTGGQNVIDPAVARELQASAQGSVQGSGVGAVTEDVQFAKVSSLQVGKATLRDQDFAVIPVRAGFGIAGSAPVDGLIGAEVLARFVTVFDYAKREVTLRMPGAAQAQGGTIPFVFGGTQPQVDCTIDGIKGTCAVDTGSRSSLDLLSPFIAAHPSVVPANATALGINGFGVGGGDVGRLGRIDSLVIGDFALRQLIAGFSAAKTGAFAAEGVAANVGGGVWKRFTITFDYPHQTMTLAANESVNAADEQERSGMFVIARKGAFVIADVRPGTPAAAAGLKRGDTITSVDGKSAQALTLGDIRQTFRAPAGTSVHLTVVSTSAETPKPIELALRDYV